MDKINRGVKVKKVLVYISKEAPRPFSLSPLEMEMCYLVYTEFI